MKPIKWNDTIATGCRWSEDIEYLFDGWTIIIDKSENDYQGSVCLLATRDGQYRFIEYHYGSCSGCDAYEEMKDNARKEAFEKLTITFPNAKALCDRLSQVDISRKDYHYSYYEGLQKIKAELNKIFGSEDYITDPNILDRRVNTILVLS
jgi:hypothetical protein